MSRTSQPYDRASARIRRILGYSRVSSREQAIGTSLQDQQNAITAYARARGMSVAHHYVEAESAIREKIESRLQMQSLLSTMREGDHIVVDKLDRWSRDPEFTYSTIRQIRRAKASFYSVSDRCDPETDEGETMLGFRILFAKEEHKRIKARMVGTRILLRDQGYYADGLAPFGYRRPLGKGERGAHKNVLAIDPEAAAVVRRAFRLCIVGRSIAQIATTLDLKRDRVADILHNRVYLGEIRDSQKNWIRALHEPLIDADTYERASSALEARTLGGVRPADATAETGSWILRDVARCFHCNARMGAAYAGPKGGPGRRYYYRCVARCTSRFVPVRPLEGQAEPMILVRLHGLREELAAAPKAVKSRVVDTVERRQALEVKRARYVEQYADGHMTRDEINAAMNKLDVARRKLDAEEQSAVRLSPLMDPEVRHDVLREVGRIERRWRGASAAIRREIVNQLCTAMRIAFGWPPHPVWRSNDDLAAEVRS